MIAVTFVLPDGSRHRVETDPGSNIMMTALGHDLDGIIGECGGSMMCATCHCYVDPEWIPIAGTRNEGEDEMLEAAASEVRPGSRLGCQLVVTEQMDGLVVHLPESQI